ncbi:hypothetical protein EV200_103461 [Pedobacter psychrotolerans]|uniref:Adhesin n=1 Tax=Pedobacter psychrotolerans TaxID=1843235 RepID=A0A4R2HG94_9SPHI|nr:hypothetical protein [Pedobacter psychrotolerans]TCO27127.1 hypothetical protein EV200_103461 [Pedobacter psychrotolerans]GGE59134.1 hypothetical protein GCM10011413_26980 [Pedobacter psychrotolerans]
MKYQLILLFTLLTIGLSASAQKQYKVAKSSGKINLNISGVIVEGYNGNEIIFSIPKNEDEETDERAKGLTVINSSGFKDNSGLGLDVTVKGDEINVNPVSISNQTMVTIKLPQDIKLSFTNNSNMYQDSVVLKNLKAEINVAVTGNDIVLLNNVGPMNIRTLHGSVDATFPAEPKGPISIVSLNGHIDVAIPTTVKANLDVVTRSGKVYAAEGLKIVLNQVASERTSTGTLAVTKAGTNPLLARSLTGNVQVKVTTNENNYSYTTGNAISADGEVLNGKINGGGIDLILKSTHNNIYIREK